MNESSSDRLYLKLHFLEGAVLRVMEQNNIILRSIKDMQAKRTTDSAAQVPEKESKSEKSPALNPSTAITATMPRISGLFGPVFNPVSAMATPLAVQVLPSSVVGNMQTSAENQLAPISAPVTSLPRSDKANNLFGFLPGLLQGLGTLATDSGVSTSARVTSTNTAKVIAPTISAPSVLPGGQASPAVSKPERQFNFTLSWTKGLAKRPSSDNLFSIGGATPLAGRLNAAPPPTSCEPPVAKKANTETTVGSGVSDTSFDTGNLCGGKRVIEVVTVEDPNPKDVNVPATDKQTPASGSGSSGVVSPHRTPEGKTGAVEKVAAFSFGAPVQPSLRPVPSGDIETVLFSNSTKLRLFIKSLRYFGVGSWQDRGVGVIRILQDTTNPSKIRVSMLRKRDREVLCNHWITKGVQIQVHLDDPKHLRWTATEFPEDHAVNNAKAFICEFEDIGRASEFRKQFEKAVTLCTAALSTEDTSIN